MLLFPTTGFTYPLNAIDFIAMSPVKINNYLTNSNHMRIFAENMKEMNTFFAQTERIAHHHHDVNIS